MSEPPVNTEAEHSPVDALRAHADTELAQRIKKPQRHRLLQGYPAVPLMRPALTSQYALHEGKINPLLAPRYFHTSPPPQDEENAVN